MRAPRDYTPKHLADKILQSKSAVGERGGWNSAPHFRKDMKAGPLILVAALLSGLAIVPASAVADVPPPTALHSFESNGSATVGLIWYFGGGGDGSPGMGANDELWSLRPSNVTWTKITPQGPERPQARHAHLSAYDTDQQLYIVFGGAGGIGFLDDTWHYTPAANQWSSSLGCPSGPSPPPGPAPRWFGAMAYDPASAEVAMFGGEEPFVPMLYGDTWTLQIIDGAACWTERGPLNPSPSARANAAMAYVPTRGTLVLYGGSMLGIGTDIFCDLWEWDGSTWREIAQTGGPCIRDHSLAFDELSGRLVVFGGQLHPNDDSQPSLSTFFYQFATGTWTEEASPVSPPRAGAPMALDREARAFVLFGGTDGTTYFEDTVIIPIAFEPPVPALSFWGFALLASLLVAATFPILWRRAARG